MCWSAQVSLNTFLLTAFTTFLVWFNGSSMFLPIFMMAYGVMQLNEYFVWTYLDNPKINMILSIVAMIIIGLQPLVSLAVIDGAQNFMAFGIVYALFLFMYLSEFLPLKTTGRVFRTVVAKNGHLKWVWWQNMSRYVCLLYALLLFVPMFLARKWSMLFITCGLLIVSVATYLKDGTWTSMWCWMVNILAIYVLVKMFFYDTMCEYVTK